MPFGRLQSRLLLLVVLAAAAVVAADALSLLTAYRQTIDTAQSEAANLSRSLADEAHGVFQTMDTILVGLRERVERDGVGPAARARLAQLLRLRAEALPMVHRLVVIDEHGQPIVNSAATVPAPAAVLQRPAFRHHAATAERGPLLGWPVRDPVDGTWVLTVSRRVDHPDGSFAGMVLASVDVDFFARLYAGFDTGRHGVVLLVRNDGVALARWPADPRGQGFNVSASDLFTRIIGPGDRERFENFSQADRLMRFASYHRVPGSPALVMVGRSRADVLAGWWMTAGAHALGLCAVLGTLALLARRLARKIGEEERAQAVLRTTNGKLARSEAGLARANGWLEMAEQIAQVGHWHIEVTGGGAPAAQSVMWSEEIYRIHGVDPRRCSLDLRSALAAYHAEDRALVREAVSAALADGRPYEFTARLHRPNGSERHVLSRGLPQTDEHGRVTALFGVVMDITEQKRSEAALREAHAGVEAANQALEAANRALEAMAMQDALTGLANRRSFDRALDIAFSRAARDSTALALVLLDVDHFKQFNDIYGHQAGDVCLQAIAGIIPGLLAGPSDTGARYGGEEIAVLLPGSSEGAALALAHRIAEAVRALAIPHGGSAHGVVTISAGVQAFVPVRSAIGPAAELVAQADVALYAAKRAGRDRVFTYADSLVRQAAILVS